MLKKMHVVCLIFKAQFTQDSSPFPQTNKVEVLPEAFCTQLNNIDQGGVGEGSPWYQIHSRGGSPVS